MAQVTLNTASLHAQRADTMLPAALAVCVAFLGLSEDDVIELRDNADLLPALLAGVGLELRRKNDTSHDEDHAGRFCRALLAGWGTVPFTSSGLLKWAVSGHSPDARTVLQAARAMCRLDGSAELTARMIGMQLAQIDGARLVRVGEVRGAAVWQLRDLRD